MTTTETFHRCIIQGIMGVLSNRQWLRLYTEIKKSQLGLSKSTLENYAQFKKEFPRTKLNQKIIKNFDEFQNKHKNISYFSGKELLEILQKIKPKVTQRQLINGFYKAKFPYRKESLYSFEQASQIVFYTLITRNRKQ